MRRATYSSFRCRSCIRSPAPRALPRAYRSAHPSCALICFFSASAPPCPNLWRSSLLKPPSTRRTTSQISSWFSRDHDLSTCGSEAKTEAGTTEGTEGQESTISANEPAAKVTLTGKRVGYFVWTQGVLASQLCVSCTLVPSTLTASMVL